MQSTDNESATLRALEQEVHSRGAQARVLKKRHREAEQAHRNARIARLEWRRRFYDLAAQVTPYIAVEGDGALFFAETADTAIGKDLFSKRTRKEMRTLARALSTLDAAGAARGRELLLDIGANIGTAAISALTACGFTRAIAFEPTPRTFRTLRLNVVANDLEDRLQTVQAAVSDREGIVELVLDPAAFGKNWIAAPGAGAETESERTEVPAVALDGLVARGELDPAAVGLVWMDVEGHEGHVLAGASMLLERAVPVVLELAPHHLRRAGSLDTLQDVVRRHYTHMQDLHRGGKSIGSSLVPITEFHALCADYAARQRFTDVLLCSPGRC